MAESRVYRNFSIQFRGNREAAVGFLRAIYESNGLTARGTFWSSPGEHMHFHGLYSVETPISVEEMHAVAQQYKNVSILIYPETNEAQMETSRS